MKRCVWELRSGRICGRPGQGSPPLCPTHEADYAEQEEEYRSGNAVVDQILANSTVQGIFSHLTELIDKYGAALERGIGAQQQAPQGQRPVAPQAPKREDPRVVLGFSPDIKLTQQLIKERKRKLAELCHPDHGGSEEAMRRINTAADALLQDLKKHPPK